MKYISFIHLVNIFFIMLLFSSCSNSEIDLYNRNNDAVMEVEQSIEFNSYKKECVDLASHIKKVIKRTSSSDTKKIVELYQLYQVRPEQYKELLEYQIKQVIGKDSIFFIKKVAEVYKKKQNIVNYLDIHKVVDNDRKYISSKLLNSMYSETSQSKLSVSKVMTRSEANTPCERECEEDRNSDLNYAQDILACGTLVNTVSCIFTGGTSWWIGEFGIAYVYDRTVRKAWEDYERCIARCENS